MKMYRTAVTESVIRATTSKRHPTISLPQIFQWNADSNMPQSDQKCIIPVFPNTTYLKGFTSSIVLQQETFKNPTRFRVSLAKWFVIDPFSLSMIQPWKRGSHAYPSHVWEAGKFSKSKVGSHCTTQWSQPTQERTAEKTSLEQEQIRHPIHDSKNT